MFEIYDEKCMKKYMIQRFYDETFPFCQAWSDFW